MAAHLLTIVHDYAYFQTNSNNIKNQNEVKTQINASK